MSKSIYLIGSLKNREIIEITKALRGLGLDVFSDWISAGPDADDYLRDYYRELGMTYSEVLQSHAARHIFEFDKKHLERCDYAMMVMPAGKSGHIELGYFTGLGKPGFILMDGEPERVDIMHQFAEKIFMSKDEAIEYFSSGSQDTGTKSLEVKWRPGSFDFSRLECPSSQPDWTEARVATF